MTASITWNRWGPLLVGGLVGTSSGCCCPKPCTCFINICPYTVSLVFPSQLITETNAISCVDPNPVGRLRTWAPVPGGLLPCSEGRQDAQDRATVEVTNYEGNWGHHLSGLLEYLLNYTDIENNREVSVQSSVRFDIRGVCHETYAEVTFGLIVNVLKIGNQYDSYSLEKKGLYRVQTACKPSGSLACLPLPNFDILHIVSPLSIELNKDTTSLGPYTQTTESASPGYADAENDGAREAADCVAEAIAATFEITMRPTCATAECDCTASLAGTTWNFMGEEFQYGTEYDNWSEDGFQRWYFSGNGAVYYESYDPSGEVDGSGHGTRLLSRKRVDIYCDYVNGEPTWVVILRALCAGYDPDGVQTHHAEDTWIGQLFCYSACEDEFRSAGDPIPLGGPQLVSFIGRENLGLQECSPGGQPFITVSQTGAC